ncbi:Nitrile hydratase subunit beta [Rhodobacteraceae bacterium THAF1]|uniref:nitrile hydratase subunit beta n=1 Tax=Palleronia sp. THAF1 TaxID=2587842 RepID=UPI000F41F06E|nr:nitrile hydratase subunit beta [Palleronia sp. THAF1]QFU07451.1 Nitrile hydratase subunit beta [Palleronia sp. THAF1]VDC20637.1 Nitrile hydratase subunit beta [Rhodobacteraceae bacterium THAF1]
MTGPHDMGGVLAGPVDLNDHATFAQDWHARAMALTVASGSLGQWTIDRSRHAREVLPRYAEHSYYEKWINALADLLVRQNVVSREELSAQTGAPSPLADRRLTPERVAPVLAKGSPVDRPGPSPAYTVGQRVRTGMPQNVHISGGHTRLPAYAAEKTGTITAQHGCQVLPDTNAHGLGEQPEPLYTVTFAATDLFDDATPGDEVRLDLWQSYLSPA